LTINAALVFEKKQVMDVLNVFEVVKPGGLREIGQAGMERGSPVSL
jgi:hypothetical protein